MPIDISNVQSRIMMARSRIMAKRPNVLLRNGKPLIPQNINFLNMAREALSARPILSKATANVAPTVAASVTDGGHRPVPDDKDVTILEGGYRLAR